MTSLSTTLKRFLNTSRDSDATGQPIPVPGHSFGEEIALTGLVVRSPTLHTVLKVQPHQSWVQGDEHLLLLAALFLIQARMPLAFLTTQTHCWLTFRKALTNTPGSISSTQFSSHSAPFLQCCLGLLWPLCRTWPSVLLNFIPLASAQWSACPDPSVGPSYSQAFFIPIWCHLKTYWGCPQSPYQTHQWRYWTDQAPVPPPTEHHSRPVAN